MPRSKRLQSYPKEYYQLVEDVTTNGDVVVETTEPFVIRGRYFAFLAALRRECENGSATDRVEEIRMLAEQVAIRMKRNKSITFYRKSDDPITRAISDALQKGAQRDQKEFDKGFRDDEAESAKKLLESLK